MKRPCLLLLVPLLCSVTNAARGQVGATWSKTGTVLAYADFDGDQILEIVSAFRENGRIAILDATTGQSVYDLPAPWGNGFEVTAATHDIDGDALPELVIFYEPAPGSASLGVFEYSAGYAPKWTANNTGSGSIDFAALTVGSSHVVLHDGAAVEVYAPLTGMLEFDSASEGIPQPIRSVSILDLDADPNEEIVIEAGTFPAVAIHVIESSAPLGASDPRDAPGPRLAPGSPNPFGEQTNFRFDLDEGGPVTLKVYDVSGRLIRVLHDGHLVAGRHSLPWDGTDGEGRRVGSGVYYAEMEGRSETASRSIVRIR